LFKTSKYSIDRVYANNNEALNKLDTFICRLNAQLIDTLYILTSTSPEGSISFNKRLAKRRSEAIVAYLKTKYSHIDFNKIVISEKTHLWNELVNQIKNDSSCAYKIEIGKIAECATTSNQFEHLLKKVDQGNCFKYIAQNYLYSLRNATAYHNNKEQNIKLHSLIIPPLYRDTDSSGNLRSSYMPRQNSYTWKYPLALKTNLLFDALTALNIELEVPLTKRWSINAGYYFPWWYLKKDKIALHILYGYIEGRYWFNNKVEHSYCYHSLNGEKNSLKGWYGGFYIGKGIYDLMWKSEGVKGDIRWSGGLSFGYVHPISKHFALEFGASIGYVDTDYKRFTPKGECLLWKSDESVKWIGITQAKISLVWRLGFKQSNKP